MLRDAESETVGCAFGREADGASALFWPMVNTLSWAMEFAMLRGELGKWAKGKMHMFILGLSYSARNTSKLACSDAPESVVLPYGAGNISSWLAQPGASGLPAVYDNACGMATTRVIQSPGSETGRNQSKVLEVSPHTYSLQLGASTVRSLLKCTLHPHLLCQIALWL